MAEIVLQPKNANYGSNGSDYFNRNQTQRSIPVTLALLKIEKDMNLLDNVAERTPQLTPLQLFVLLGTVAAAGLSPAFLPLKAVELLVPSMAAVAASVGLSAEYAGKVAVSKSKEIAALATQATAEAEILLATAERSKAILPVCVGVSTTASALALLAPSLHCVLELVRKGMEPAVKVQLLRAVGLVDVLLAMHRGVGLGGGDAGAALGDLLEEVRVKLAEVLDMLVAELLGCYSALEDSYLAYLAPPAAAPSPSCASAA
eukprot:gene37922-46069_t